MPGPSLLGSMGPWAGQVKTQTNYKVGLFVLCHATKSTPTTCPPNKISTTRNNSQVEPVEADNEAVSSTASSSAVAPPSSTVVAPVSSYGASPKGAKGGPFGAGSIAGPSIWISSGGMPNSRALPDARSCLHQKCSSSLTVICCGISINHSSGSLKT